MGLTESSLVKTALPNEIVDKIWDKALWTTSIKESPDSIDGSVGIFRLRGATAPTQKEISTPWKYHERTRWNGSIYQSVGKYRIFEHFKQCEYYELMAFAENLSEEDFQHFAKFFWKNTMLWLYYVVE